MFRPPTKYSEYLQDVRKSIDYILKRVNATTVTQIVAGTNVTISPASGTGVVTINASGGGGGGLPAGGTTGQILAKINNVDYNAEWIDNYALWTSTVKHEVKAGEAINKGQAVYVSSADGTNMIVSKASNALEATSSKTLGILAQSLAHNAKGFVITEGLLAGLDTSAAGAAGDPVWLGTDGNLLFGLANKPYAPANMVSIGVVTRKNSSNGEIFVRIQNGFELDELHNVDARNPNNNDGIFYNSTTQLWEHKPVSAVYATPTLAQVTTAGNTTTNAITVGGLVVDTNTLVVDAVNNRVGIGTTNPSTPLDVIGAGRFSGYVRSDFLNTHNNSKSIIGNPSNYTSIYDGSGIEAIRIVSNGNVLIGTTTDAGYKLDVNGTARVSGNTYLAGDILVSNGSGTRYIQSPNGTIGFLSSNSTGYNLFTGNSSVGIKSELYISNDLNYNIGIRLRTSTTQTSPSGYGYELSFQPQVNHVPTNIAIRTLDSTYGGNTTVPSPIYIFGGQNTTTGTYGDVILQSDFTTGRGNVAVGTTTALAKFTVAGSITAASALAQGVYFNNTLVAAANNDVLVGLDINPTFTNGAFTGVQNLGLRVYNGFNLLSQGNGHFLSAVSTTGIDGTLIFRRNAGNNGAIRLQLGGSFLLTSNDSTGEVQMSYGNGYFLTVLANGTEAMRIPATRNVLIGTTTDSGYKLDVNGTARVSGALTIANPANTIGLIMSGFYTAGAIQVTNGNPRGFITTINGNADAGFLAASNVANFQSVGYQISFFRAGNAINITNPISSSEVVGFYFNPTISGQGVSSIYAFRSSLAGAANRWNLYMQGTALNYIEGNVLINTTTDAGYKLDVNGTARVQSDFTVSGGGTTINATTGTVELRKNGTSFISINNDTFGLRLYGNEQISITPGFGIAFGPSLFAINTNYSGYRGMNIRGGWNLNLSDTPLASAILQADSTVKGFLQPRMTNAQALAITTPATGLQVYDTTNNKNLLYNGTAWQNIAIETWLTSGSNIYYNTGNVGIGTSTPTDKLHIVDNTNGNKFGRISAGGTDASAAWVAQNDQVDNVVYRVFGSAVTGTQMGISLARSASLMANLGGSGKFLVGTFSSTDFVMGTGNQERMRLVDSTGNFLVGTTTDLGNKLEVSGTINATAYKINNTAGYTGILNIPTNPPGQQNIDIQSGIVVNIF